MGIVNGTFDTDLSGWNIGGTSEPSPGWPWGDAARVEWVNEAVRLFQNICASGPYISQKFLIDNTTLSFDYNYSLGLRRWFNWKLVVHKKITNPDGTISIQDITAFNETFGQGSGSGVISKDVSQYIEEEATITFTVYHDISGCDSRYQRDSGTVIIDNVITSPNWGTLRVSSTPGGANIYIDDAFLNITPESGSIDLTDIAPGSHTVKITKTDYYDSTATVNVLPGRIYDISATLNPQVGCLSFLSDPAGAKIFLSDRNGQVLNDTGFTTSKQICDLLWGDYKWKLLLDGYYPQEGTVTLNTSAGAVITKTLTQIGIGCIYFTSSPAGAKIFVDNVDTGKVTPDTICGLSLGSHHYELVLAGYLPASGDITLVSTHGGSVSLNLTACTPNWQCESGQTGYEIDGCGNRRANPACLAKGSIKFTSTPAGAEIFIDGSDQGKVTPHTITDVPVGSHGYTLKLDGFKDYTGTVPVLENQIAEVSVSLIPLESCIYFVTSIPGAKIFVDNVDNVDNVDTGKVTPALICGLSLGSHTYRLELAGYKTVTGSVGIGAGQGVVVASVLAPVEKGTGAGTLFGLGLLGVGILGIAIASRRKPQ